MTYVAGTRAGCISLTNYISFEDPLTRAPRIGSYDEPNGLIQPLAFASGTPLTDLHEVIQVGEDGVVSSGAPIFASSTKILPPLTGRDILCVGKNYADHAREFNSSGYDSSDKVDQPTHPVIFTKRFTSIIAHGDEIYAHPEFTKTADYEGEIGVIIGKPGFRITEANATNHVWGYTIINDMTARERQRDHKQFYIGKSPDTYCPMGPVAVPAHKLERPLRVQTRVNGELRQNATTEDLIFSIPFLIKTLSEGQTLMSGDVLATGTPAGVGLGLKPPVYLQPGDEISVSVTGLGSLTNKIGSSSSPNLTLTRMQKAAQIRSSSLVKIVNPNALTDINDKPLHYQVTGCAGPPIIFIHGLGGTSDYWLPLIQALGLEKTHSLHLFDLEGHGLSPTSPQQKLTLASFAADVQGIFSHAHMTPASGATIIAHSLGCLVALKFALQNPSSVRKLLLLGPPPSPLPALAAEKAHARAATARAQGMTAVADAVIKSHVSARTKRGNALALAAMRMSLLAQDAEGYAKACAALALSATEELDVREVRAETLVVTGDEDVVSPLEACEGLSRDLPRSRGVRVLAGVGHWHVFEDVGAVADAVGEFLLSSGEADSS